MAANRCRTNTTSVPLNHLPPAPLTGYPPPCLPQSTTTINWPLV
uniref:Uncharacterized protein n=1 Tax=Arundo donax TaxID=35708 RepID=A0A0A9BM87_ARUDO